jgi:cell division protein FtsW
MTHHRITLLICATLIFAIGLVMIFSTTSAEVLDHDLSRSTHQALLRQMAYAVGGLLLVGVVWLIGYRNLIRLSPLLLLIFTGLLIAVLIPGIGREINGSRRWMSIGGFSFQPSEFVKYLVPAYFIHYMLQFNGKAFVFKDFLRLIGILFVPILLIMVEPNNGTAAVIGLTVALLCFLTRIPFKFWGVPLCFLMVVGGICAYNLPYVSARLNVYLHPELDLKGKGHQPYQAKIAAGSGQLLGKGPGNSLQKLSYLPEAQNDYIAAIYAEEFGFLGIISLIALYMLLAYLGFSIASHAQDQSAFYFAGSITFLICFQAFLNLGVVSGTLPSTGLNLPLFSQGGTSLIANIMGLGLLLNISMDNEKQSLINASC